MAFVYEEVGKEKEALWNEIGWRDWAKRLESFSQKAHWIADRDRHIYMLHIGSFRFETPDYYDLSYRNIIVRMEVVTLGKFCVKRVCIPKSIWEFRDEICECIKEAFVAYEKAFDPNKAVTVDIDCELECVEADYNGR